MCDSRSVMRGSVCVTLGGLHTQTHRCMDFMTGNRDTEGKTASWRVQLRPAIMSLHGCAPPHKAGGPLPCLLAAWDCQ